MRSPTRWKQGVRPTICLVRAVSFTINLDCPVLPRAQHRSRKVSDETLERVSELAMHNRTLVRGRESAVHEPAKNSGLGQRTSEPHSSKLATETSLVRRKYI